MLRVDVKKTFPSGSGAFGINVRMDAGQNGLHALYGKSGAGKTTLLRMIAGLVKPDGGSITLDDKTWFDSSRDINLPPQARSIGFVFQDQALFPNMTVLENLEYAAGKNNGEWVIRLVESAGLGHLLSRRPDELSGGEKQRAAIARALARKPKLLLMDEPLSALDDETRSKLQDELLSMNREFSLTTVMVTHDLSEIFKMANSVLVIESGRIAGQGKPFEVFSGQNLAGQFRFVGELAAIEKQDIVFIVSVIVGNNIVKVMATGEEVASLAVGDKVVVISKAFNPLIMKPAR